MLQTPVLMVVFNRPEITQRVFAQIRKIKPRFLFIAADGPRAGIPKETINCKEVRKIVTAIDWDCELKTLFRDENLGCGRSVSGAINWFFEHVEEGIILEDDCLPSISFFPYCEELLIRYRSDDRIFMISGFNAFKKNPQIPYTYYFSLFPRIWGWATWKRAWSHFNYDVPEWDNRKLSLRVLKKLPHMEKINNLWIHMDLIKNNRMNAWSPQWWFYMLLHNKLSILPVHNLVINIGFIPEATHTLPGTDNYYAEKELEELTASIKHPDKVEYNYLLDREFVSEKYGSASWFKKLHWKYQRLSLMIKSF